MTPEITEHSIVIAGGTHQRQSGWTVKEYAADWGVSERTVWTWISKKAVVTLKTPGGRVRILGTLK